MKKNKCKFCGKYKMLAKEVGKKKYNRIFDELEIPVFRFWKWCKMNNNWCRNIAGKCGEVISEKEKPDVEFEEKQGFDFKMTMEDEI
jgi:hypothetical protein